MGEKEKKRSLRNEKLKVNRTSETEEQRKERLRIRREKDRARKKRSSESDDYENQRQATLKRLKRSDENKLERKLRLEKMVATKRLRSAMETDEKRRGRPRIMQLPNGSGWPWRRTTKHKQD